MSFKDEAVGGQVENDLRDPALHEALDNFRLSVHAWSEAAYNRPRTPLAVASHHKIWRLAAAWTLGCALVAGGVSGGVFEHHQKQVRIAAALEAERQRQLSADRAREEEDLLAKVDSDVSRQVPSAMEPLAQLMDEDESR
jgi:hypothetical protein